MNWIFFDKKNKERLEVICEWDIDDGNIVTTKDIFYNSDEYDKIMKDCFHLFYLSETKDNYGYELPFDNLDSNFNISIGQIGDLFPHSISSIEVFIYMDDGTSIEADVYEMYEYYYEEIYGKREED